MVQFQVHEGWARDGRVVAVGRLLAGRLRVGLRMQVQGESAGAELVVTRIRAYGHVLEALDPGMTAQVEFSGGSTAPMRGTILAAETAE